MFLGRPMLIRQERSGESPHCMTAGDPVAPGGPLPQGDPRAPPGGTPWGDPPGNPPVGYWGWTLVYNGVWAGISKNRIRVWTESYKNLARIPRESNQLT